MNLKNTLKTLKLNESTISMVLGGIVILVVGFLVVNYFRNLKTGGGLFKKSASTEATEEVKRHTVSKGETLWSISEKYFGTGYNWTDIAKVNSLANPDAITEGQTLTIPSVEAKKEVQTSKSISGGTYTVARGDNLWDISVRAYGDGYQWVKIARENKLANPDLIHAGNVLSLPR